MVISWTNLNNGIPAGESIMALVRSGSTIFAVTNGDGSDMSTNNGTNWALVNTGLYGQKYERAFFLPNSR